MSYVFVSSILSPAIIIWLSWFFGAHVINIAIKKMGFRLTVETMEEEITEFKAGGHS